MPARPAASAAASAAESTTPACAAAFPADSAAEGTGESTPADRAWPQGCHAVHAARAALARGDGAAAHALLGQAQRLLPEVAPELRLLEGEAALLRGDVRAAQALADAALATPPASTWLRASWLDLRARAARTGSDAEAIVRTHRACLAARAGDTAAMRAHLSDALIRVGRNAEGDKELRLLLTQDAGHPAALARESRLRDGSLPLSERERVQRLWSLQEAARFATAAQEFEEAVGGLANPHARVRAAAHVELERAGIEALVKAGRLPEALARVAHDGFSSAPLQKVRAWVQGKAGQHVHAAASWQAFAERSTEPGERAEGCFFSAFALYEANDLVAARAAFQACEARVRGTAYEASAQWYGALAAWLAGDLQDAAERLQVLVDTHEMHAERHKHRYWLARAWLALAEDQNDAPRRKRARTLLDSLQREAPTSYYGMLARKRLGEAPLLGALVEGDALARLAARDPGAARARRLFRLGFDEAAREAAASRGRKRADFGVSHQIEDAHRPWRHGALHLPRPAVVDGHLVASPGWRVSYAAPYGALVAESARVSNVDDAFVYAIMRTESGFLPSARSRVGAIGLMQLMPYTARGVARMRGRPMPRSEELAAPMLNIELGVSFLGRSQAEFGHEALAAAAYNGGPAQVARWLAAFGHLEPELFVERVPYRETRDYIKRVSESAAIYRALRGSPLALRLPDHPFGAAPREFTWFPPSDEAPSPFPGARAPP